MSLEASVDYIDDLQQADPAAGDVLSQTDDHIRFIKKALKQTFPGSSAAGFARAIVAFEDDIDLLAGADAAGLTSAQLLYLAGVTAGTAVASKALVLDALKDISGINDITAAQFIGALTGGVTGDVTGNADTATLANTIISQGALATMNSVGAGQIDTGAVGASEIATSAVGADEIAANAVGASEIATGAVGTDEIASGGVRFNDEIALGTASGSWEIDGTGQVIPRGVYNCYNADTGTVDVQVQVNGSWRLIDQLGQGGAYQLVSDGTNVRLRLSAGGTSTVYYDEIFN